jgi:flagellar motility protein MotE (MotC chaperone)
VVDEKKDTNGAESQKDQAEANPEKKTGIMKLVVFAGAGLILTMVVAFASYFLFAQGDSEVADTETSTTVTVPSETASTPATSGDIPDSLLAESDPTVIDAIMENLAFLDYEPVEEDLQDEQIGMSVAESLETVNWLDSENQRLREWEKKLNAKQREQQVLDAKISKKILTIEQAESSRVASLAKLYDGMDTRAVAQLMANLDDNTVVSILPRMKTKNASSVLSMMPSKRAARLSKLMITIAEK